MRNRAIHVYAKVFNHAIISQRILHTVGIRKIQTAKMNTSINLYKRVSIHTEDKENIKCCSSGTF